MREGDELSLMVINTIRKVSKDRLATLEER